MSGEKLNWVDPDIVAELGANAHFDVAREAEFKAFFELGWLDPQWDDIRERWDSHLNSLEAHGRVLAKTALWSVVMLRRIRKPGD